MPNQITYNVKVENTTKQVEYWNPYTQSYEDNNVISGIPAGNYSDFRARLKGSNPEIVATFNTTVTVVNYTMQMPYNVRFDDFGDTSDTIIWETNSADSNKNVLFVIDRASDSYFTEDTKSVSQYETTFTDNDLLPNTQYYFRITATATGYNNSQAVLINRYTYNSA